MKGFTLEMTRCTLVLSWILFLSIGQGWSLGFERVELHCLSNRIELDVVTTGDFSGTIYAQGSFRQNGCYLDARSGKVFQLGFALNECKTEQKNSSYRNVMIVQHEDELITKDDIAFEIQCDYKSIHKTVDLKKPLEFLPSDEATVGNVSNGQAVASISVKELQIFGFENRGGRKKKSSVVTNGSNVAVFTSKHQIP